MALQTKAHRGNRSRSTMLTNGIKAKSNRRFGKRIVRNIISRVDNVEELRNKSVPSNTFMMYGRLSPGTHTVNSMAVRPTDNTMGNARRRSSPLRTSRQYRIMTSVKEIAKATANAANKGTLDSRPVKS